MDPPPRSPLKVSLALLGALWVSVVVLGRVRGVAGDEAWTDPTC